MDITRVCAAIEACFASVRGAERVARVLREDIDLRLYPTHNALLRALRSRSPADRADQARIVRALLRRHQQGRDEAYGGLLLLAYQPMLCAFAQAVRKHMLRSERGERHELVLASFFEAASRMATDREDAPILLNLAMKTKQSALRELTRRRRQPLEQPWEPVDDETVAGTMHAEVQPQVLETGHALLSGEPGFTFLHEMGFGNGVAPDSRTMRAALRAKHPNLSEKQFHRLDQRVRKRRSRLAAGVRRGDAEMLSQIRDHVDLVVQEDSHAWIEVGRSGATGGRSDGARAIR